MDGQSSQGLRPSDTAFISPQQSASLTPQLCHSAQADNHYGRPVPDTDLLRVFHSAPASLSGDSLGALHRSSTPIISAGAHDAQRQHPSPNDQANSVIGLASNDQANSYIALFRTERPSETPVTGHPIALFCETIVTWQHQTI